MLTQVNDSLLFDGTPLFTGMPRNVALKDGHWLHLSLETPAALAHVPLGRLAPGRFLAVYRQEPFWMRPATGRMAGEIPVETQVLFLELPADLIALIVPLVDGPMRCSLAGRGDELVLVAETGTLALTASEGRAAYIAVGRDLHALCEEAAKAVAAAMKTTTRVEKMLPPFVNGFGWCTWDAFYQEVSPEKIREGLESFRAIGMTPKFLIIDDGWQSEQNLGEEKGRRLTALFPNGKFGHDLRPTVQMAKQEFGVSSVLVWHALQGYWDGVDTVAFPQFQPRETARDFSPGVRQHFPEANTKWWGHAAGVIPPENVGPFFLDYHALLASMQIDGVKVDNQAALEGLAGTHGRVAMYRQYLAALEASAQKHFRGNLLHCMSCANDLLYRYQQCGLVRTSTDFWPDKPETHGLHLWTNAVVSTWFGQFIWPDWDMFQSGHPWGEFHAAARAISGGPIYVSDKPGQHDAALLRKLVLSDGTNLRCDRPVALTHDSLFADPLRELALLKIWNTNRGGHTGVIGLFNCQSAAPPATAIGAALRPSDVPTLDAMDGPFVMHHVRRGHTHLAAFAEPIEVSLCDGQWELVHVIPLGKQPAAVIGLVEKWNGPGAVTLQAWHGASLEFTLLDGGDLTLWCAELPVEITVDGVAVAWKESANVVTVLQVCTSADGQARVRVRMPAKA